MEDSLKLRLKDLDNVTQQDVNYSVIMKEVLGFNNYWIGRKAVFKKKFMEAYHLVKYMQNVNPKLQEYTEKCGIKKPSSIDNISFKAMMELQATLNNGGDKSIQDVMIEVITIACYSENIEGDYLSDSDEYTRFRKRVSESPMIHMFGLYNWIDESLTRSNTDWEQKFLSVQVEDKDYELAGGHRMSQFNVINTIKCLCQEFNCTYDSAWQMSYALTQVNSYEKASRNYTQDQMRKIKEVKMKRERDMNTPR